MENNDIFDTLKYKSRAELIQCVTPAKDFSVAYWQQNNRDIVNYQGSDLHTLSVYKYGYENVVRTDVNLRGVEESYCLMPAGTPSDWSVEGPLSFFHIYFNDDSIKRTAERVYDKSGSSWNVPDICYKIDKELIMLSQWFLQCSESSIKENTILVEQNIYSIMTYLTGKLFTSRDNLIKGGLSHRNQKLMVDYINEYYCNNLNLKSLAELTNLSEYHFMRMFKQSFGVTPHDYINRVRIERVKELLNTTLPLSQIAADTGFSSQPHLTRVFKKYTSRTPGNFKRSL